MRNYNAIPKRLCKKALRVYELSAGRMQFRGPEANIGEAVRKLESDNRAATPAWQQALQAVRLPLYDVHWTAAVVLTKGAGKKGDEAIRVGLPDGRVRRSSRMERRYSTRPRAL